MKRLAILVALAAALAAFVHFDVAHMLTLANLKAQQGSIDAAYHASPVQVAGLFVLLYVVLTAISFPGAAILTLAAGAIFGLGMGLVLSSFASTIGATLSFLSSRYLFRDAVQKRFGDRLKALNAGVERDGAFYLFSLRLVPIFPFFMINLAMGLTPIRVWTFFWVSQLGMLLGTAVYVNAGTRLAEISSLRDVASPALLASFAALGLLPWAGKAIMGAIRRRRIYARFTRPRRYDRNMVVIGAGAAGLVTSIIGATVKAKVTLVEAHKMGGDCLNYGCVPSKALIKSARVADQIRHAGAFGIAGGEPEVDFRAVMARVRDVITAIEPHDSVERYTGLGVDVVQGYARIVDPWRVEIARNDGTTQILTTRSIVIAAGGEPVVPPLPGIEQSGYLTSDTLWDAFANLDRVPERIVVLGGGAIGCELAQALARLGGKVTQVEMTDRVLASEDDEVSDLAKAALEGSGIEVLTGHKALRIDGAAQGRRIVVEGPQGERAIAFDALIVAVGRKARLTGYGLEELGIATERTVVTDEYLATEFPNIFAAGDVAGPFQFTHTASHQAWYAAVNALFGQFRKFKADYRVIPRTTYIDPEVARVGLNEREAKAQGIPYEVTTYHLDHFERAIMEGATTGFVKVLSVPGKDRILGVTIVGEHAGELIGEYVLAMKHELGLKKIMSTIHAYPTMIEANKFAAGEWRRAHAPQGLLRFVERYHAWRRG
ncbi:FAD-dependent oxidoreductase [Novosphingobium huizhouense]|uniref:FAD-dependent oxidoreductase n=1 Tax=Novosphingobium huizhouense TaxID=2866625 RepID=UPI001CD81DB0|nr:bifunctional TVP38/TMEM64 family protein/FAD-dependent oxidoreductase [Novosphingobium huizhouense]